MNITFEPTDALVIIDPQNDFVEGGALEVKGGKSIMKAINALALQAHQQGATVVLTQDWHPSDHKSFASSWYMDAYAEVDMPYGKQTLWPNHCVQGSEGAAFHADIASAVEIANVVVRKGMNPEVDSYSAFFENDKTTSTGLGGYLHDRRIKRVYLVGLAYDFCVGFSALDSANAGFETIVLKDLTKAIAIPTGDGTTATAMEAQMLANDVNIIEAVAA